jgi:hypothetical protein
MPNLLQPFKLAALVLSSLVYLAPSVLADQNHPTVRVTTGSVQINGWEHNLLQGDPNLKNWHWNPIYANVQGTQVLSPIKGPNKNQPNGGGNNVSFTPAAAPRKTPYIRPNHVQFVPHQQAPPPLPVVERDANGALVNRDLNGNLINPNVNGNLMNKNVAGTLMNKNVSAELQQPPKEPSPPAVATYGGYGNYASTGEARTKSDVYGTIRQPKRVVARSKSKVRQVNY